MTGKIRIETIERVKKMFEDNPTKLFSLHKLNHETKPLVNFYTLKKVLSMLVEEEIIEEYDVHGEERTYYKLRGGT